MGQAVSHGHCISSRGFVAAGAFRACCAICAELRAIKMRDEPDKNGFARRRRSSRGALLGREQRRINGQIRQSGKRECQECSAPRKARRAALRKEWKRRGCEKL